MMRQGRGVLDVRQSVAFGLFILVNLLFCFKYSYRLGVFPCIVSVVAYTAFVCVALRLFETCRLTKSYCKWIYAALALFIAGSVTVFAFIDKETLNVDRWLMIQTFWDAASDGVYPYGVHAYNGNYPGPMPFYFILYYPLYIIDEIGFGTLIALVAYVFYIRKSYDTSRFVFASALLLSSVAMMWETAARSTIFFNAVAFFLFFLLLKNLDGKSRTYFFISAIIGGMVFSMRNVYAIPLLIWGIYSLYRRKVSFGDMLLWVVVFILAFVATFVPFVLMEPSEFLKFNPFVTQGSVLLPFAYIAVFLLLSAVMGFVVKSFDDIIFSTGVIIFLVITCHVVYGLAKSDISLFMTIGCDISYYMLSFPFLIHTILEKKNDKR